MTRNRTNRRGVTLIELMVAMALTLVIMLILAEAFKSSLDFVRSANSTGSMIYQLNGAGTVLGRDLQAEHFAPDDRKPNRGVRLSDQRLDWRNNPNPNKKWDPPPGGFFRLESPAPPASSVGLDQEGYSFNSGVANHRLHFTAILPGGSDQNRFSARVGNSTFSSRAAEVAYFLERTGQTDPGPNGVPLYNLVRRYRLVAMDDEPGVLNPALTNPTHAEVISVPSPNPSTTVNTLATVANPANRLTPLASFPVGLRYGEDILLSNTLSFEVLADWNPNTTTGFVTPPPRTFGTGPGANSDAPYDYLPGAGVFDTTNPQAFHARIKSLQVTIRVWDPKMKQARQNTWKFAQ